MLIIMVGIIVGGLYQFSDAFRNYVANYMGEYLACLLETGELPDLGIETKGECNEAFEPFSLASGRPPKEGATTTPTPAGSTDDGNLRGRVTSAGSVPPGSDFGRSSSTASSEGGAPSSSVKGEASSAGEEKLQYQDAGSRARFGGQGPVGARASFKEEDLSEVYSKKQEKEKKAKKKLGEVSGDELRRRVDRVSLDRPKVAPESEDEPWGFGDLIRYLIIIAIILAIVIFLGGQALQISKSWD